MSVGIGVRASRIMGDRVWGLGWGLGFFFTIRVTYSVRLSLTGEKTLESSVSFSSSNVSMATCISIVYRV